MQIRTLLLLTFGLLLAPLQLQAQELCVPTSSAGPLMVSHAWDSGDGIGFCAVGLYADSAIFCAEATPNTTDTWRIGKTRIPRQAPQTTFFERLSPRTFKVCHGDNCHTVKTDGKLAEAELFKATYHPKFKRVAVLTDAGEDAIKLGSIEIYDLTKKSKRLAKVPMSTNPDNQCGHLTWLGDALGVFTDVCAGPGGEEWLAHHTTGKRLASLGSASANMYGATPVFLKKDVWAVLSAFGKTLFIQNTKTGKIIAEIALEKVLPGKPQEHENTHRIVALPAQKQLALIMGGSGAGHIALFDINSGKHLRTLKPPYCKAKKP